ERLPWSKGYNILPVQSDEIVCLKMITPQTFGMIQLPLHLCCVEHVPYPYYSISMGDVFID
ncbi:hypothetical protein, partial [Sphingobacterium multivorum]